MHVAIYIYCSASKELGVSLCGDTDDVHDVPLCHGQQIFASQER